MSSEQYRWSLVEGFVDQFNHHRSQTFIPSDLICVDESFSRWYGQGGNWINHGLPHYVEMDHKPEAGCEIQNAACGRSGVMLQLRLVRLAREEANKKPTTEGLNHSTVILKSLVMPWSRSFRTVCADSYFASVNAAAEMSKIGLRFIGVVKTATRKFPMAYLSGLELQQRGDWKGVISKGTDGHPDRLAFVWMDRDRQYFIATTGSLLAGTPYARIRWWQINEGEDADPDRVELTIPQPMAVEPYYSTCSAIDKHNRCRQDTLDLEKKLKIRKWDRRVNMTLFGIIMVDTSMVYSKCMGTLEDENQTEFYTLLAKELIDNSYDSTELGSLLAPIHRSLHKSVIARW